MQLKSVLFSSLAFVFAQTSHAAVLAYDGLSGYTEGNISGQTMTGFGFTGGSATTWQTSNIGGAGGTNVTPGGLTYSKGGMDLVVSGNQQVDQNDANGYVRATLPSPITSGVVYMSALAMAPTTNTNGSWGPLVTVNDINLNPAVAIPHDGAVHLSVFKIDLDNALFTIWLDPTPGTSEASNIGTITPPFGGQSMPTSVTAFAARGGWDMSFDEIRFGDTFEDVTPAIPEPSGMIMLGLGSIALLLRRNQR